MAGAAAALADGLDGEGAGALSAPVLAGAGAQWPGHRQPAHPGAHGG